MCARCRVAHFWHFVCYNIVHSHLFAYYLPFHDTAAHHRRVCVCVLVQVSIFVNNNNNLEFDKYHRRPPNITSSHSLNTQRIDGNNKSVIFSLVCHEK